MVSTLSNIDLIYFNIQLCQLSYRHNFSFQHSVFELNIPQKYCVAARLSTHDDLFPSTINFFREENFAIWQLLAFLNALGHYENIPDYSTCSYFGVQIRSEQTLYAQIPFHIRDSITSRFAFYSTCQFLNMHCFSNRRGWN